MSTQFSSNIISENKFLSVFVLSIRFLTENLAVLQLKIVRYHHISFERKQEK